MKARPLDTTEEYYKALLESIRKAFTVILKPSEFNALINLAELEFVMGKLPEREFNQKRLDDLSVLRVFTDGKFIYDGTVIQPIPAYLGTSMFALPKRESSYYDATSGMVKIGNNYYPLYLSGARIDFKIGDNWIDAKLMRSDQKSDILKSGYRKPSATKVYFDVAGQWINGYFATGSNATAMNLEYYAYPRTVFFDENTPGDIDAPGQPPPVINPGSVNSVFEEYQKREIIDIATRRYLEIIESPRYKSMLNELSVKQNTK